MGDLSRRSSRRALLPTDDTESLTSFPDPAPSSPPRSQISVNERLSSLVDRSEPSMFDERPTLNENDPQALSAATRDVLEGVIERQGAVDLIKRLSAALAERDAHVTALQRLCEEYKVPSERIAYAASRVKQFERRRLSLAAASEDNEPLSRIGIADSENGIANAAAYNMTAGGTVKGLTRLFGGTGTVRRADTLRRSPSSSRSASVAPKPIQRDRESSIDARSMDAQSTDSGIWTGSLFGTFRKRQDSKPSREPVEMRAQLDPDQLPPTLSENPKDPQEAEWNRYILKLMKAREQSGEQEADGTLIGATQFGREGAAGRAKMEMLTKLVIGGVPNRLRHPIWMELANTPAIVRPDAYQRYLSQQETKDPAEIEAIIKDVPRTLTQQYDYYVERGYEKLKHVLVAFVAKYEGLGYTQGLNMIAGHLLLAIPAEEDAFWMLCNMVDNFFPANYFSREAAMSGPLADNIVLRGYIKELMPKVNDRLDELEIPPQNTIQLGWLLTAFSDLLPRPVLQRVWDVWLCLPKQKTFLFYFTLALFKQHAEDIIRLEDQEHYFAFKWRIPEDTHNVEELIRSAFLIRKRIDQDQLMERRQHEIRKLRKSASTEALYSAD